MRGFAVGGAWRFGRAGRWLCGTRGPVVVARQADGHGGKLGAGGQINLGQIAVTSRARDLFVQVLLVVELEVGLGNDDSGDHGLDAFGVGFSVGAGFAGHADMAGRAGRRGTARLLKGVGPVDGMADGAVLFAGNQAVFGTCGSQGVRVARITRDIEREVFLVGKPERNGLVRENRMGPGAFAHRVGRRQVLHIEELFEFQIARGRSFFGWLGHNRRRWRDNGRRRRRWRRWFLFFLFGGGGDTDRLAWHAKPNAEAQQKRGDKTRTHFGTPAMDRRPG